jgi:hypothetical protein
MESRFSRNFSIKHSGVRMKFSLVGAGVLALGLLGGCSSVGVGFGIPVGPFSVGVGAGSGGVSAGVGTGVGPFGVGVGVNQGGQVTGGAGVGASTSVGGGARAGVGVGTGTVLYDPNGKPSQSQPEPAQRGSVVQPQSQFQPPAISTTNERGN